MLAYLPYCLPLAVVTPLVVVLLMIFCGSWAPRFNRPLATAGFLLPTILALLLAWGYDRSTGVPGGYAYLSMVPVGLEAWGISLSFGLNGVALAMFVLAAVVGLAAGLYAIDGPAEEKDSYLMLLLVMFAGLLGTFATTNLFFFFFFHELALIPTFVMIGRWGGKSRKSAAMDLTIYLTAGAMLTLIGLIAIYVYARPFTGTFDMRVLADLLAVIPPGEDLQWIIAGLLVIGLGILVSLFPFHTWAPRGYAVAPTSTAMMHAGVLKKFGLYGLIQVATPLLPVGMEAWAFWIVPLALMNVLYIGWVTVAQRDLKMMLGYSSVMHMGYAFLGIATLSALGIGGAVLIMVGHGLTVALLFLLATSVYRRTGTYDMGQMGGLCTQAPVLSAFFIAATLASLGLPGFINFWGELTIFISLWEYEPLVAILAVFGVVISAVYGLRAVAAIFFGPQKTFDLDGRMIKDFSWGERWPAILLLGSLLFFGIWPRPLTAVVDNSISTTHNEPIFWVSPLSDEHARAAID